MVMEMIRLMIMLIFIERMMTMMMMMMVMMMMVMMMMMMMMMMYSSRTFIPGGQDLWAVLHDAKISTTDIYGERMMMDRRGDDLLVGNMGEAKVQTGMIVEMIVEMMMMVGSSSTINRWGNVVRGL
jgi:hypothetical protein